MKQGRKFKSDKKEIAYKKCQRKYYRLHRQRYIRNNDAYYHRHAKEINRRSLPAKRRWRRKHHKRYLANLKREYWNRKLRKINKKINK